MIQATKIKKPLIVTAIDFSKTYDSIKREKIIEVMKKYKIESKIINSVVNIYTGDTTKVLLKTENPIIEEINITSGIRQGCTASTTLFKLITYELIERLNQTGKGFQDENFKINTIFLQMTDYSSQQR